MTQKARLLEHLQEGKTITRLNGWQLLGIIELPARISELKREGWPIVTHRETVINRYGEKVCIAIWQMDGCKP